MSSTRWTRVRSGLANAKSKGKQIGRKPSTKEDLTNRGRWSFGISAGVLAFFVLGIGLSPAGFAFIILITNIISLFIQNVENHFLNEFTASALMQRVKAVREGNDA